MAFTPPSKSDDARINEQISVAEIRLIDMDGNMVGVVSVAEGIAMAREVGLDLVEVSPNAEPPVCKILDYGKYKYEAQKKAQEAKKKQKTVTIKEIKLRPNIDTHDFEVKMKAVQKFLEEGNKVKLTLRFRGREMAHMEIGMALFAKVRERFEETIKVEHEPRLEGRQAIMVVSPVVK